MSTWSFPHAERSPVQEATRIIAVRHGETTWNVDTRIQGQLDIPLNERGRWQADRAAAALATEAIDTLYTSDLQRAHATAQAIGRATGSAPVALTGLRERATGSVVKFNGFLTLYDEGHDDKSDEPRETTPQAWITKCSLERRKSSCQSACGVG